jgi:ABC-type branched-subunit amino acid transport system permease subunit
VTASRVLKFAGLLLLILFPWLPGVRYSLVVNANQAAEFSIIAISLVILTGWVGQISLAQGSFVGIGAFATGVLVRQMGIPFPINLPIVAALTGVTASLLGIVALRVRGLYLAVATLIFAWMADAYLFTSSWLVGKGGASSIKAQRIGTDGTATFFDLSDKRLLYLVMVAAVAAVWYIAVNLRDSKTGRAFFAVRGSETAAVSLGIDVTRYKLLAFAISGALAGVAGNLIMIDLRSATPFSFQFTVSLFYLSIAVVGGIASLGGAVAASVLFAGLSEAFFRLKFLNGLLDIVTVRRAGRPWHRHRGKDSAAARAAQGRRPRHGDAGARTDRRSASSGQRRPNRPSARAGRRRSGSSRLQVGRRRGRAPRRSRMAQRGRAPGSQPHRAAALAVAAQGRPPQRGLVAAVGSSPGNCRGAARDRPRRDGRLAHCRAPGLRVAVQPLRPHPHPRSGQGDRSLRRPAGGQRSDA